MQVLNIFHVLIAIAMIAFILIQKGAGATAGAAFGSGASGTVFGARGAGNFLSRSTWVLATFFCLISLTMAVMASRLSMAPESDLGVVASTPVNEPVTGQVTEGPVTGGQASAQTVADLPVTIESAEPSDLPFLDAVTTQPAAEYSTGDLPVVGPEAGTAEESADEAAATDDGS